MSRAELADLCDQYARAMHPGMEVIENLSDRECVQLDHEGRRLAVRIADAVIEAGLHRGEVLR